MAKNRHNQPTVQEPVVQEPVVQEPMVQEPVVQEPVVQEPMVQEPMVQHNDPKLKYVHPSKCCVYYIENLGRPSNDLGEKKEIDEVRNKIVQLGWVQDSLGQVKVKGDGLTAMEKEKEMALRTARYEELKANAAKDPGKLLQLKVWEMWMTNGKGRINEPEWLKENAHRRFSCLEEIQLIRYQQNLKDPKLGGLILRLPILLMDFATDMERLIAQAQDNTLGQEGKKEIGWKDVLLICKSIFQMGGNQNKCREAVKAGSGQKAYDFLILDSRFPEAKAFDRVMSPPENGMHLRYPSYRNNAFTDLKLRSNPEELHKKNLELRTKGKDQIRPLSQQEFEQLLVDLQVGAGNEAKIMKKETISNNSVQNPSDIAKAAFLAIMTNDSDLLDPVVKSHVPTNIIFRLCQDHLAEVTELCKALEGAQDKKIALNSAIAALRV